MTLLTWGYACAVGVQAMDDQHGILMDTLNELRMAVVGGAGRERISQIVDRLFEYTRMHFESEENLMEEEGFPGLEEHREEHHKLLVEMMEVADRVRYGEGVEMQSIFCTLRDSYIRHIEGQDSEYGPWMNKRGKF